MKPEVEVVATVIGENYGQHVGKEKAFVVLRYLPGRDCDQVSLDMVALAVARGVRTAAILSTDDFFLTETGYKFSRGPVNEYHRRNYERACLHFLAGTQFIILCNPNIKKRQFKNYTTTARSHGYFIYEHVIGNMRPTEQELDTLSAAGHYPVPVPLLRKYVQEFEP